MANKLVIALLSIMAIAVVSLSGVFIYSTFMQSEPEAAAAAVEKVAEASDKGKIASFKLSLLDNSDSPLRYAGTAYCYDVTKPKELIGGGSITTSATAGTTVSPVTMGQTIECIGFDSTHYGIKERSKIESESDQMIIDSLNASNTNEVTLWEDNQKETSNSLTIAAGATDKFSQWSYKAAVSDKGFNVKEICFASNATSNSEIDSIEVEGWTKTNTVPYAYRNSAGFCHILPAAKYIEDNNEEYFSGIKVKTSNAFSVIEEVTAYLLDEGAYKSIDQSIQFGVEDDSTAPGDAGTTNANFKFNVTA